MVFLRKLVLSFILNSPGYATSLRFVARVIEPTGLLMNQTAQPSSWEIPKNSYTQPSLTAPGDCTAGCLIEVNDAQIVWAPNTTYTFCTASYVLRTVETTIHSGSPVATVAQMWSPQAGPYTNQTTTSSISSQVEASTNASKSSESRPHLAAILSGTLSISNTNTSENSNNLIATKTLSITSIETFVPSITAGIPSAATTTTILFDYNSAFSRPVNCTACRDYQASTTIAGFPMTYPTPYIIFTDFTVSCPTGSTVHTLSEAFGYQYMGNAVSDFVAQTSVNGPLPTNFMYMGDTVINSSFSNSPRYNSDASNSTNNLSCTPGSFHGVPTLQVLLGTYGNPPTNLTTQRLWVFHMLQATALAPAVPLDSVGASNKGLRPVLPGNNNALPILGLNVDPATSIVSNTVSIDGSTSISSQAQPMTGQRGQSASLISLVSITVPALQIAGTVSPVVSLKASSNASPQTPGVASAVNAQLQPGTALAPSITPLVIEVPSLLPSRVVTVTVSSSQSTAQGSLSPAANSLANQRMPFPAVAVTTTYASYQLSQSKAANQQVTQGVGTATIAVAPTQSAFAKPASVAANSAPAQMISLQTTGVNLVVTSRNDAGVTVTATVASMIVFQSIADLVLGLPQAIVTEGAALMSSMTAVNHNPPEPAGGQSVGVVVQAKSTNKAGSVGTLPSTIFVSPLPFDRSSYSPILQTANVVQTDVTTSAGGFVSTILSTFAFVYHAPAASNSQISTTKYLGASTTGIVVPITSIDALGSTYLTSSTSNLVFLPLQSITSSSTSTSSLARSIPQGAISSAIIISMTSVDTRGSTLLIPSTSPILVLPLPSAKLDVPGGQQFGSPTVSLSPSTPSLPTIINLAGQPVTVNPTGFQIDGHNIVPGAQGVTVSGTPVSLSTSGQLHIGSQMIALPTVAPYRTTEVLVPVTLTNSAGNTYTTASTSNLIFESLPIARNNIPTGAYTTALVEDITKTDARGSVYTSLLTTLILAIPHGVANSPSSTSGSVLVPLTTTDSFGHTYTTMSMSNLVFEAIPTASANIPSGAFTTLITQGVVRTNAFGQVYTSSLETSVLALPTGNPGNNSSSGIGGAIMSGLTPRSAGSQVRVHWWIALTSIITTITACVSLTCV